MAYRSVSDFAQSHFLGSQYWQRLTQRDRYEIMLFAGCEFAPPIARYEQMSEKVKAVLDGLWAWDEINDDFRPKVILAWFDFIEGARSKREAWPTEVNALQVNH
jgi:hypothetical protein